jgi:hypothetical protein
MRCAPWRIECIELLRPFQLSESLTLYRSGQVCRPIAPSSNADRRIAISTGQNDRMTISAFDRDRGLAQVEDAARGCSPDVASSGQCAALDGGTTIAADKLGSARLCVAVPAMPARSDAVAIVNSETVVRWHRRGFRAFGRWKSRSRGGRSGIPKQIRDLIQEMCRANWLWGAPRHLWRAPTVRWCPASGSRSLVAPPTGSNTLP